MPGQKWPGSFLCRIPTIGFAAAARALEHCPGPAHALTCQNCQSGKNHWRHRLRSGPRTPAAIRCRAVPANPRCTPQRLKIRIPQMELHGGILRRDVHPVRAVQTACPPAKAVTEAARLPAERRGQLSLQTGDVHVQPFRLLPAAQSHTRCQRGKAGTAQPSAWVKSCCKPQCRSYSLLHGLHVLIQALRQRPAAQLWSAVSSTKTESSGAGWALS